MAHLMPQERGAQQPGCVDQTVLSSSELPVDCDCHAAGDGQTILGPTATLSLFDILHEVPLLLDLMPAKSLAALVAVNQAHRRQVQNHVTRIAIPDHAHIQTLFRSVWPRLESWQIGDRLQTFPEGTHSMFINFSAALLELMLCEGSMTAAGVVVQLHHVSWSTLQVCRIKSVGLSGICASICAFCSHTWPALQRLDLSHYLLDKVAIAHLAAGCWPCLTTLNLRGTGLTVAAFLQLSLGYWPAVTDLNVSRNRLSSGSVSLLAPSPQPAGNMTDWASQLTALDLSENNMTSSTSLSVMEQLTKLYWPRLEHLSLRHMVWDLKYMSHVVHGRWPNLLVLDIRGPALGAPELQMLAQAPWRHLRSLRLTANLQDAAVSEQLSAGSEDHDQQLLRYLQRQDAQPVYITMRGWLSALSCSEGHGYMQLPKCFAEWLELNLHVWRVHVPFNFSWEQLLYKKYA